MTNLNRLGLSLGTVLLGTLCSAQQSRPAFAGWIRNSSCSVLIRRQAGGKPASLSALQAKAYRLYAGQAVKVLGAGVAHLLIYGHEMPLKLQSGWYAVPTDADKAPRGQDVYLKFTSRAGLPRGEMPKPERVWQAISLMDLINPSPASKVKIRGRVVRDAPADRDLMMPLTLRRGDHFWFEVANDGDAPVYVSVIDIDCSAAVDLAVPQNRVGAHSGWKRCGEMMSADVPIGFKEGIERFRFIATTNPVDLSSLAAPIGQNPDVDFVPTDDPLQNFIRLSSGRRATGLSDWGVAPFECLIKR